jgi:uncharacterized protein
VEEDVEEGDVSEIAVVSGSSAEWSALPDPPGQIPSAAWEAPAWTSIDGRVETGLWRREPDAWSFERPYDEVALILDGLGTIETEDGRTLQLGPGDLFVTPKGSKGTWRVAHTLTKFFATYEHDEAPGDTAVSVVRPNDPLAWTVLENPPGDEAPPGEEVVTTRSTDNRFVTGFWRRAPETGSFERGYDEIAVLQEGDVEVDTADRRTLAVGPGDVLVTPLGSSGVWRARSPVRKLWVVYHA